MDAAQWLWTLYPIGWAVPSICPAGGVGSSAHTDYRLFLVASAGDGRACSGCSRTRRRSGPRYGRHDKGEVGQRAGRSTQVLFTGVFVAGVLVAGLSGFMGAKITGVRVGNGGRCCCTM